MKRPNFFIVGAPKCGTTALHTYLREHPSVFLPTKKELRFFCSDLDSGSERDGGVFVRDIHTYLRYFAGARDATRVGEATPLYMFSKIAAKRIKEFASDAKIIIMVRDPVELMYSYHSERVFGGNETLHDFAEALAAEPERKRGLRIPAETVIPQALWYREVASLSCQIERYLEVFDRRDVFFVVYDDLKRDPNAVYRAVVRFLDLDDHFRREFKVVNANKRVRSSLLRELSTRPPTLLRTIARRVVPSATVRQRLKMRLQAINTRWEDRPPLKPQLRQRLQEEFAPEVARLSRVIGRDLSLWSAR